jgi:hypothetical protein
VTNAEDAHETAGFTLLLIDAPFALQNLNFCDRWP